MHLGSTTDTELSQKEVRNPTNNIHEKYLFFHMQTVFHSDLNTPPPPDVSKLPSKRVYVSRVLHSCIICMMEVFLDVLWLPKISLLMEVLLPSNSLNSKQISHFGKNHSTVHFGGARAKKQRAFRGVLFSTWFGSADLLSLCVGSFLGFFFFSCQIQFSFAQSQSEIHPSFLCQNLCCGETKQTEIQKY